MKPPSLVLAVVVSFATLTALPSYADPREADRRFQRTASARLGTAVERPAQRHANRVVNAIVELTGQPAAQAAERDRKAAVRQLRAKQHALLPRLRTAGATPIGQIATVLNGVRVRVKIGDLDALAAVPGVERVQVSRTIKLNNAASARFTGVDRTWQAQGLTGEGQRIAIIDSGIDYTHASFGGPGTVEAYETNDGTVIEKGTFPTAKVVAGYDFVGDDFNPDDPAHAAPDPDPDPLDCDGHGTHVAGTAAGFGVTPAGETYTGPYNRAALDNDFLVEPGMAPRAELLAYRGFSCAGFSDDGALIQAIDAAVTDDADVINMSLGTALGSPQDVLGAAIRTATRAGVLVVAAAGNSGDGAYVSDAPGSLNEVLSVAAVDAELRRLPGFAITGAVTGTGLNANEVDLAAPITGELVEAGLGCEPADYAGAAGKIAVTVRGTCERADRARLGQQAAALAVIMVNNAEGLPPLEGPIAGVTIPFVGVDGTEADDYAAAIGGTITIAPGPDIRNPDYGGVATLSSNGPRRLDSAQKPDLAAPGVSIPSVAIGTGTGAARRSGTSMSSPQVAGIAALVRQAHPTWSAHQIKAVLMSTAAPGRINGFDSLRVGTGLVQPRRAAVAKTYAWTSDRLNSLKFGQNQLTGAYAERRTFQITNRTGRPVTYDLSTNWSSPRRGAELSIAPRTVRVGAGQTRTVAVTIKLSRADVSRLPGATANDGGELVSLHGLIVARPRQDRSGVVPLRMAFLFVPVPLSEVTASTSVRPARSGGFTPIQVRNRGVHTGTAELYAWLLADPAGDAAGPEVADLTNLGVQALPADVAGGSPDDRLLVFAATQATGTSTHASREVDVLIDSTGDGTIDFITFVADNGLVLEGAINGRLSAFTIDAETGELVDLWDAVAPANGSTVLLPVLASALGATADTGPIELTAEGLTILDGTIPPDSIDASAVFDPFAPALSQGDLVELSPGERALIPVTVNPAELANQTARGWLVVTLDDRAGPPEADRVRLDLPNPTVTPAQRTLTLSG